MSKKNDICNHVLTNATDEWKKSHMRTADVNNGVKKCPLWNGHVCYPTCMYSVTDIDPEISVGYCTYVKRFGYD